MKFQPCKLKKRRNSGYTYPNWQGWLMRMSKAARLHPISAVMTLLKLLKGLTISFLVVVVFAAVSLRLTIIVTCLFIVFLIGCRSRSWFRSTYRLEDEEIRIQYGVIVRKKRYIPVERIQSLDFSENI